MVRVGFRPSIHITHPRRPEKSYAYLSVVLEGKREDLVEAAMTEADLYDLAHAALSVAATLRRLDKEERG